MSTFSVTSLAHSFSYALLYSLWQGTLIYGLLYVLLKALPGLNARIKYNLSLGALGTLFICFADTWESQYRKLKGITVYITQSVNEFAAGAAIQQHTASAGTPAHFDIFGDYLPFISQYVPLIIAVYCIGLAFMMLRFTINLAQLRPLKTSAVEQPPTEWLEFVKRWETILGISRPVKLLLSHKVNVPIMLGALKPVILLPVSVASHLTTEQVEAILMHELAHIRRHDYLINLIQTLVETVLFFNPFVWLISSLIRREREHCCDDLVLSCAADPLHYAQALTLIEHDRINSLSLAATGNRNQLFHRIKRIMEMKKENIAHRRYSLLLVALVATFFMASMVAFTPTFAQKSKTEKTKEKETEKKGEPQKVSTTKTITKDGNGKKKVITKTTTKNASDDDDAHVRDVHVNVSVEDDDHGNASAKIIVFDDDKNGTGKKKIKREMVFASGSNGSARSIVINDDQIQKEIANVQRELENIDWEAISAEIEAALADVEAELDMDMDGINKKIRVEVRKNLEKSRAALQDAKREVNRSKQVVVNAHGGNGRAYASARGTDEVATSSDHIEEMLYKMEKDGLINRSEKFKVEKENGELYINGQKQSQQVMEKYGRYLKGKEVTIKGGKGNLSINVNN